MGNYLFGFLSGFILMLIIAANHDASIKSECEQSLPRTQQCVLIAVPEDSQ